VRGEFEKVQVKFLGRGQGSLRGRNDGSFRGKHEEIHFPWKRWWRKERSCVLR
jgi:hypothetical protein